MFGLFGKGDRRVKKALKKCGLSYEFDDDMFCVEMPVSGDIRTVYINNTVIFVDHYITRSIWGVGGVFKRQLSITIYQTYLTLNVDDSVGAWGIKNVDGVAYFIYSANVPERQHPMDMLSVIMNVARNLYSLSNMIAPDDVELSEPEEDTEYEAHE